MGHIAHLGNNRHDKITFLKWFTVNSRPDQLIWYTGIEKMYNIFCTHTTIHRNTGTCIHCTALIIKYNYFCDKQRQINVKIHNKNRQFFYLYFFYALTECPCTIVICSLMNMFLSKGNVVNIVGRIH